MPVANITNVNPYAVDRRGEIAGTAAIGQNIGAGLQRISEGIVRGQQRRKEADEENKAIAEREIKFNEQNFGQLQQASTGDKFTDVQLQGLGKKYKSEFYQAKKAWDESDHGEEAQKAYSEARERTLGSAKQISGGLEAMGAKIDEFKKLYAAGGVSNAVNPAIREFMLDMQDGSLDPDHYQIVEDEETGKLKYVGETAEGGHPVELYLDDLATGKNQFAALEKADLEGITKGFVAEAGKLTEQFENDLGLAYRPNYDEIRKNIGGRVDNLLENPASLRKIGAELGYDYNKFEEANATPEGREAMIADMRDQLIEESVAHIPNQIKQAPGAAGYYKFNQQQDTKQKQAAAAQELKKKEDTTRANLTRLSNAANGGNASWFERQLVGEKVEIGGEVIPVHSVKIADGNVVLQGIKGGKGKKETFNLQNRNEVARLGQYLGWDGDQIQAIFDKQLEDELLEQ